ncbi:MAG: 2-oxo acid dehydrogenase subunit E2 [Chloroflexi bacterium]|nr:2-oxo acid dehydrogenase subunit E2 [Chloroflexota bacterium]
MDFTLSALNGDGPVTVGRWRRQAGERVAIGEPLLEAHSARFDWDIPAPCDGVLETVAASAGALATPGDRLALIRPDSVATARPARISPLAARMAAAYSLPLDRVPSTGRIERADVLAALAAREAQAADTIRPLTTAQRERAERVARIARDVPHGTVTAALDLSAIAAERAAMQPAWARRERVALDDLAFLVHAAVAALLDVPECNATVTADGVRLHRTVHVAISIDDGTALPRAGVIANAERYNIVGIARRLSQAQTDGSLEGGTLTIRSRAALLATDLVADGQTAVLNIGPVVARAVAAGEAETQVHPVVHVSLTCDRRAVSDAAAQRFLERLATSS